MRTYESKAPTLSKLLHGWLAVRASALCHGKFKQPLWPFCDQEESISHLFQCQKTWQSQPISKNLAMIWEDNKETIQPSILEAMKQQVNSWQNNTNDDLPKNHAETMKEQHKIGWPQFLCRRLSTSFWDAQIQHLANKNNKNPTKNACIHICKREVRIGAMLGWHWLDLLLRCNAYLQLKRLNYNQIPTWMACNWYVQFLTR